MEVESRIFFRKILSSRERRNGKKCLGSDLACADPKQEKNKYKKPELLLLLSSSESRSEPCLAFIIVLPLTQKYHLEAESKILNSSPGTWPERFSYEYQIQYHSL